jgi:hypothetical protein
MANPEQLRLLAERMLTLAMDTSDQEFKHLLTARAAEYLERAQALEAATPPIVETPQQQAEEPQPNDLEKKE